MTSNLMRNSILSIILGGAAAFSAAAVAEIGAEGRAAGQGSAAASAVVDGGEGKQVGAASQNRAAVSGDAGARVNEDAIRGSVKQNTSAVAKASASAAKNTAADAKQSGRAVRQEASHASRSVSAHGDAGGAVNGAVNVVETGDGVSIDLNSATSGNAGITVRPVNAERTAGTVQGEAGRLSANAKGNATALSRAGASGANGLVNDTRGAVSASGSLTAEIASSTNVRQDLGSTVQATVEESVTQGRAAVDAAVNAAVDAATEVRGQMDAALEQTRNLIAEAAGELEVTGSGGMGL